MSESRPVEKAILQNLSPRQVPIVKLFWSTTSPTYTELWSPVGQQMRQLRSLIGASLEYEWARTLPRDPSGSAGLG